MRGTNEPTNQPTNQADSLAALHRSEMEGDATAVTGSPRCWFRCLYYD